MNVYLNNSQSCKTAPTSFIEQEKAHHTSDKEFIARTSPLRLPKRLCNRGKTSNKCCVSQFIHKFYFVFSHVVARSWTTSFGNISRSSNRILNIPLIICCCVVYQDILSGYPDTMLKQRRGTKLIIESDQLHVAIIDM